MSFVARHLVGAFGALEIADGDRLWCAYLESDPRPGRAPDALARLLADAAAAVRTEAAGERWPSAMAAAVDGALRRGAGAEAPPAGAPTSALFAAAMVTADAMYVCTAGDLRVHLLCDGVLRAVTRDHVWSSDPPEVAPAAMAGLPPEVAAGLSTRWLGGSPAPPPESARWPIRRASDADHLLVEVHRRRAPAAYLPGELASPPPGPGLLVVAELGS